MDPKLINYLERLPLFKGAPPQFWQNWPTGSKF